MPLHPEAEFEAAKSLYFAQDYDEAAPRLEAVADIFPIAHHYLGVMAQSGLGQRKEDMNRAAQHYGLAADGGVGQAAYNLGILYQAGLLEDGGMARAHEEYIRAYELGYERGLEKIREVESQAAHLSTSRLQLTPYHAKRRSFWDRLTGRR